MGKRILLVDDRPEVRAAVRLALLDRGHEVVAAAGLEPALEAGRRSTFDVVVTGLRPSADPGAERQHELGRIAPAPLVVLAGSGSAPQHDGLFAPLGDPALIASVVERAIEHGRLVELNRVLFDQVKRCVDELEGLNVKLTDMANRDRLTGLYNLRFFREALEQELSRARRHGRAVALILIDLDDFGRFNETHGFLAADDLLRTVARLLQESCRSSTLAARHGGEQFALLVPEVSPAGAVAYAEQLRQTLAAQASVGGGSEDRVTVSIGVATYPEAAVDAAALIERADEALDRAKGNGRNAVMIWEPTPV